MATRPVVQAQNLIVIKMTVASGQAVTKGYAVVHSGSDTEIDNAGADSDLAIGVALEDGAAGELVDVALFGYAVVEAEAGTGGVTRGKKQILAADGFTDAPADNGATTTKPTYGYALQSASAGDKFSLVLAGVANRTTT